jgi:SNF2 family DNA or RNA helicase
MEQAAKRGLRATFIDGTVKLDDRTSRVKAFQQKEYDIIFLQPQSASHGITLTSADCTIWASPTYLSDYYSQGNNRMIRTGQTKRTTIINIEANKTLDHDVYDKLNGKLEAMNVLQMALE